MYEYEGRIVRVIDGDTVMVDISLGFNLWRHQEILRLAGINAPEVNTSAGRAAAVFLRKLLPEGATVTVVTKKDKKEKYGRYLASISINGENVSSTLLSEGHAQPYMV